MFKNHRVVFLSGIALLLLTMAGCNGAAIQSIWRQQGSVDVSNRFDDSRPMLYLEDQKVSIGLQNDADNLYVTLKTSDRGMRANVMRAGLTVWLDPKGKKNKTLGIHFPLGMQGMQMHGMPSPAEQEDTISMDRPRMRFAARLDTLEILGPRNNKRIKVSRENNLGISAVLSDSAEITVYDLIIPMKSTNLTPYALDANPGKIIEIGFETGNFNRPNMDRPDREDGGMPGGEGGGRGGGGGGFPGGGMGGFPGGRGGFHGGRGGMQHEGKGNMMSGPLKYWTKVILAEPEAKEK